MDMKHHLLQMWKVCSFLKAEVQWTRFASILSHSCLIVPGPNHSCHDSYTSSDICKHKYGIEQWPECTAWIHNTTNTTQSQPVTIISCLLIILPLNNVLSEYMPLHLQWISPTRLDMMSKIQIQCDCLVASDKSKEDIFVSFLLLGCNCSPALGFVCRTQHLSDLVDSSSTVDTFFILWNIIQPTV